MERSFLLWVALAGAAAQNPITWKIERSGRGPVEPKARLEVVVTAAIEDGWRLYSITQPPGGPITTRIRLLKDQPFVQDGRIEGQPPLREIDRNFDMEVEYHEGSAAFQVPVRVAESANAGPENLRIETIFQSCNEKLCLPPKTVRLELPVELKK